MTSLADIQRNFIETINLGPDALDPALFTGTQDRILLGLKAHANTISHARLIALEDTFPLTRKAMGDAAFNAVSRSYCDKAATRASDANSIGKAFAAYLYETGAATAFTDLAHIEWAWLESYNAADATSLEMADLAYLNQAELLDLPIAPHPAARLVRLATSGFDLIGELGALPNIGIILITRPFEEVRLLPLDATTAAIFRVAQQNTRLCNLLAIATEITDEAEALARVITLIGAGALILAEVSCRTSSPDTTG